MNLFNSAGFHCEAWGFLALISICMSFCQTNKGSGGIWKPPIGLFEPRLSVLLEQMSWLRNVKWLVQLLFKCGDIPFTFIMKIAMLRKWLPTNMQIYLISENYLP